MYLEEALEIKEKVLECIRDLKLSKQQKLEVALKYKYYSEKQKTGFDKATNTYDGRVNPSFKNTLEDKYIYAQFATDENGVTMVDYLLNHKGFKEKRATSFSI